eukprot:Rmarinus@m.26291
MTTPKGGQRLEPYIIENEEEYCKILGLSDVLIVIDIHAGWCGPCYPVQRLLQSKARNEFQKRKIMYCTANSDHIESFRPFVNQCKPVILIVKDHVHVVTIEGPNTIEIYRVVKREAPFIAEVSEDAQFPKRPIHESTVSASLPPPASQGPSSSRNTVPTHVPSTSVPSGTAPPTKAPTLIAPQTPPRHAGAPEQSQPRHTPPTTTTSSTPPTASPATLTALSVATGKGGLVENAANEERISTPVFEGISPDIVKNSLSPALNPSSKRPSFLELGEPAQDSLSSPLRASPTHSLSPSHAPAVEHHQLSSPGRLLSPPTTLSPDAPHRLPVAQNDGNGSLEEMDEGEGPRMRSTSAVERRMNLLRTVTKLQCSFSKIRKKIHDQTEDGSSPEKRSARKSFIDYQRLAKDSKSPHRLSNTNLEAPSSPSLTSSGRGFRRVPDFSSLSDAHESSASRGVASDPPAPRPPPGAAPASRGLQSVRSLKL